MGRLLEVTSKTIARLEDESQLPGQRAVALRLAKQPKEAVINAVCAAETMTGRDGHTTYAIPLDRLRDTPLSHGRVLGFDRGQNTEPHCRPVD